MVQLAGMDRNTGKRIAGFDHVRQSVVDILTTRVGTRVMRRAYGSDLPNLVDRPINAALVMALYAATAEALARWEPRIRLRRVQADLSGFADGKVGLSLTALYLPENRVIGFEGIVLELKRI